VRCYGSAAGERAALVAIPDARETQRGVTLTPGSGIRFIHEQYPDSTEIVFKRRTHNKVANTVCFQITDDRNGTATAKLTVY
jgi:hypothetical protein